MTRQPRRSGRRRTPAALVLLALALTPVARAAAPQFWRIEGTSAFLEGELEGVSVDSEGHLRLGPLPRPLFDPEAPNAWCVARDARGVLYVGTGNEGRVIRIDGAAGSVLLDAEELAVHAIAVGPDGRVYAASSPDGAVWAIDSSGRKTLLLRSGREVHLGARVRRHGRARASPPAARAASTACRRTARRRLCSPRRRRTFSRSPSAATGGSTRAARPRASSTGCPPEAGPSCVVDTPFREIKALAVGANGSLYAAGIDGRAPETTPRPATAPAARPGRPGHGRGHGQRELRASPPPRPRVPSTSRPAPSPRPHRRALCCASSPRATSTRSGARRTTCPTPWRGARTACSWGRADAARSTAWVTTAASRSSRRCPRSRSPGSSAPPSGGSALVTANPARVLALDGAAAAQGRFVSRVKDADSLASWGRLSWEGDAPPGTSVQAETRAGNTATPDTTWTEWSAPSAGGPATGEKARFLQVRLVLTRRFGRDADRRGRERGLPAAEPPALDPLGHGPPARRGLPEADQRERRAGDPGARRRPAQRAGRGRASAGRHAAGGFVQPQAQPAGPAHLLLAGRRPERRRAAVRRLLPLAGRGRVAAAAARSLRAGVRLGHRHGAERPLPAARGRVRRAGQSAGARAHGLAGRPARSRSTTRRRASRRWPTRPFAA